MARLVAPPPGTRGAAAPALAPGDVVASTYLVGAELARADTGAVYEARDLRVERTVALKLAWRDPGAPDLLPEARWCAAVGAPAAAAIHAVGYHHDAAYVVGERLVGAPLGAVVARAPRSVDAYLGALRALAAAVAAAHAAGVAVGALGGDRALVTREGRLVLDRLALSQALALARGPDGAPAVAGAAWSPVPLAPELLLGLARPDDPAAAEALDLYALGCAAHELATGAPPFAAADAAARLDGHARRAPPRLGAAWPGLPAELDDLVAWLLAKAPAARPRSVADVVAQLDAIAAHLAPPRRPLRVLVVDADAARGRWLGGLARRAHPEAEVALAATGGDGAHALRRDRPALLLVHAGPGGAPDAPALCLRVRALDARAPRLAVIGALGDVDERVVGLAASERLPDDARLAGAVLDLVRAVARARAAGAAAPARAAATSAADPAPPACGNMTGGHVRAVR